MLLYFHKNGRVIDGHMALEDAQWIRDNRAYEVFVETDTDERPDEPQSLLLWAPDEQHAVPWTGRPRDAGFWTEDGLRVLRVLPRAPVARPAEPPPETPPEPPTPPPAAEAQSALPAENVVVTTSVETHTEPVAAEGTG